MKEYEITSSTVLVCTVKKERKKLKLDCEQVGEELSGIVIDEERARTSPCIRIDGTNLVFSKGIIGTLNKEQREKYCPTIITKPPSTSDVLCVHLEDFDKLVKEVEERIKKVEEKS